jgi:hypothetical protein
LAAVSWSNFRSGASHYELSDASLVLGALGLFLGGVVGMIVGDFRR